ncbi:MAG: exopolysaccharide biosynthesis protein [Acidobacteriota bacterium]
MSAETANPNAETPESQASAGASAEPPIETLAETSKEQSQAPEGVLQEAPRAPGHRRLSKELQELLDALDGQDTTLGALVDAIGERGFCLLLAVLALPAALPVPAPGYATPFGLLMIGLGFQMFRGRPTPTLPAAARRRRIGYKTLERTIRGAGFPLRVAEFLVRPRLRRFASSRGTQSLLGIAVTAMACFMCLPIPLTNTAPSFVIFLLACGLLEEDGLLLLGALLLAPPAAGIALTAVYFGWKYGLSALDGGMSGLLDRVRG